MAEQKLLFRRGTKDNLEAILKGEILRPQRGEPIAEINSSSSNEDYIKFKIGDGEHDYADLPYVAGGSEGPTEYLKSASVSGNKLTLIKQDDSTIVFEPEGVVYTAGDGIKIEGTLISVDDTIAKQADLEAEVTRATAAEGDLDERLTAVEKLGRYLSTWDTDTGLPGDYPIIPEGAESPYIYTYKAGDHYVINNVPATGTKFMPKGDQIIAVKVGDTWEWTIPKEDYTGSKTLVVGGQFKYSTTSWDYVATAKDIVWGNITGNIEDQADLQAALANKSKVEVSAFGTSTNDIKYIKVDGVEYRLPTGGAATVYQFDCAAGADHQQILNNIVGAKYGDIAIIREAIDENPVTKRQYTAYVYMGTAWAAMDGNYNAENVYFAKDLQYTTQIGELPTVPSTGAGTIAAKGKNVKEVLGTILSKERNPIPTLPSLTITSDNIGEQEVGTNITINYGTEFNPGSYTYGPDTGITASNYKITFNGETLTTTSGTFASVQVTDTTNLSITGKFDHTQGTIPKTNLGKEVEEARIEAKEGKDAMPKGTLKGFRKMFYGTKETKEATLTSELIRSLNGEKAEAKQIEVPITTGAKRTIIAVPDTFTVKSIKDVNGLGAELLNAFKSVTIAVEGANNYIAINYKVYYLDYANEIINENIYKVTII